jgi:hypothetical protein
MKYVYSLIMLMLITGCSSQQAYSTGQAYQREQCNKINDNNERARCMEDANKSQEEYQRQQKEAK